MYKAEAIYHITANGQVLRRTYLETADRARGLAYFLKKHEYKRVGILCPNTPGFLDSIFGIAAAGAVNVGRIPSVLIPGSSTNGLAVNYRLKEDDIAYIFSHSDADLIIADAEFLPLLETYRKERPHVAVLVDTDNDASIGPFHDAILEGLRDDCDNGNLGWDGLEAQAADEEDLIALAYTSGTTARPKGVEYTHRGCYLAAMGNVIESGLNFHRGRCGYLWTLPMFHAMGMFSL